jgi:uncharacterized protein (TIGR02466 family)
MQLNGQVLSWFPTNVYRLNNPSFIPMATQLFSTTDWEKYKHKKYKYGGETTYFNNTPLEFPGFNDLKEYICKAVEDLAEYQGVDMSNHKAEIQHIWLNSMHNGAIHERHAHPGAHYSGTYYVNKPPGASRIRFFSPTADHWGLSMPPIEEEALNEITAEYIEMDPVPGNLLVWNSWLYHEVLENKSTIQNRNTISFNVILREVNNCG